jgi:hypothetical protein
MSSVNTKTDRKYLYQYRKKAKNGPFEWVYSSMPSAQGGFPTYKAAKKAADKIMKFHNDFVLQHYRLVERTVITVDEVIDRLGKEW